MNMNTPSSEPASSPATSWLSRVREVRQPLNESCPIWMREHQIQSGPLPPQPTVPFPERHPFCEMNLILEGQCIQYIGHENIQRSKGHLMLLGPGIPHYAKLYDYPHHVLTLYFLPTLLFEMGPQRDGPQTIARFTCGQSIEDRNILLPDSLRPQIEGGFNDMLDEFDHTDYGSEMRLRSLLAQMLVSLIRWEVSQGRVYQKTGAHDNWGCVEKALRYLQENYTQQFYIKDVAKASRVSVNRLQSSFKQCLGMSCMSYLMEYRITHAAALLSIPGARIIEVAMSSGFNTLSHFNASFRRIMGMSPSEYAKGN